MSERESGLTLLTYAKPCRPKPLWDLSLVTMPALEQVSVINDLKGTKKCWNREKAVQ